MMGRSIRGGLVIEPHRHSGPKPVFPYLASVVFAILLAACTQATPTATPTPLPASQGVHTPEDYREQYERWPEEYKFAIDDEVTVRFSYPGPIIDWAGFAFISHIPSASSVVLRRPYSFVDAQGNISSKEIGEELWGEELMDFRHYESAEGEVRLESVLGDEVLMRRILSSAEEDRSSQPVPTPTKGSSDRSLVVAFGVVTPNPGPVINPTPAPTSTLIPIPTLTPLCKETIGIDITIDGRPVSLHESLCLTVREPERIRVQTAGGKSYVELQPETGEQTAGSFFWEEASLIEHFEAVLGQTLPKAPPPAPEWPPEIIPPPDRFR